MKVVFAYAGTEQLGVESLSACLKQAGHRTALAFDPALFSDQYVLSFPLVSRLFDRRAQVVQQVVDARPDLLALSAVKDLWAWASELAAAVKRRIDVPVVVGGIHASSVPERLIADARIDYLVVGEGEQALVDLASALERGEPVDGIANVWSKRDDGAVVRNAPRPLLQDLDRLPFPDKELFAPHVPIDDTYLIMTTRGCPFDCSFCSTSLLKGLYRGKGRFLRRRGVDHVIDELLQARARFGFREVNFSDDVFTFDRDWLQRFLERYRQTISLPFRCLSHPQFFDEGVARLLRDSGCHRVRMSGQTMNEHARRTILRRRETNAQIVAAFEACDRAGLAYTADHLLGVPTEGEQAYREAAEIYTRARELKKIKCYYLDYFPGTAIVDIAREQGALDDRDLALIEAGRTPMYFSPSAISRRDPEALALMRDFELFFKLLPVLPEAVNRRILDRRLYRLFHHLPRYLALAAELLVGVLNRDSAAIPYLKYYARHLRRALAPATE